MKAPKVPLGPNTEGAPSAYFTPSFEFEERVRKGADLAHLGTQLVGLDMGQARSFYLPRELSCEERVTKSVKPTFASAVKGKLSFRVRSGPAYKLVSSVYRALPEATERTYGFCTREAVREKMLDRFFVSAGAEYTLGRLQQYYPRVGSKIHRPTTEAEARAAVRRCGLDVSGLPPHQLRPFPLQYKEDEENLTANPKADNGFPVGMKWGDVESQGLVRALAQGIRDEIVQALHRPGGVAGWKEAAEEARPELVACMGKAKADYYGASKISGGQLRFYNVFGRQILMNMQVATQPFERLSKNALDGPGFHSVIGVSLYRGGADRLVEAMEAQLLESGMAYVHCGDDSWVAVRQRDRLYQFALDCSSFDLTQHADATLRIHEALRDQLRLFDKAAAELWFAYARSRLVATSSTIVRKWRHGGPSGMPLQSKINDVLMDVLLHRLRLAVAESLWKDRDEEWWDYLIRQEGEALGLKVRVEQFSISAAATLREALVRTPFLFIGYYFHVKGGRVVPCTDVPRTMSQAPYPSLKWQKTDKDLLVMEAMRLGSMYLSAGIPPVEAEPAFQVWRESAIDLLEKAIAQSGDVSDERLAWAVGEGVFGPDTEKSLGGLLRVLRGGTEAGWRDPEVELQGTSELVSSDFVLGASWADAVEAEEASSSAVRVPEALPHVRPRTVRAREVPTHPPTLANQGRPPPTAVWGPDKAPRLEEATESPTRRARRVRAGFQPYVPKGRRGDPTHLLEYESPSDEGDEL